MKKYLVMLTVSAITLGSLGGCGVSEKEKSDRSLTETEQTAKPEEMAEGMDEFSSMMSKEEIVKLMPEITKKAKKILVDNGEVIDPLFDMKEVQLLVVSTMGKAAYLTNSQDKKYGEKDDVIEYATETITETDIMVAPFGKITFNGKDTYFFNVDMWMYMDTEDTQKEKEDRILDTLVHEAVHIYLQPLTEKHEGDLSIQASSEGMQRARSYPIEYQSRISRAQQTYSYREALKVKSEEERIKKIKEGNYFYEEFLKNNAKDIKKVFYDKVEGQATYLAALGLATLETPNVKEDEKKLQAETNKFLLRDKFVGDGAIELGEEDIEYYTIGSLAYGNIQALGLMEEVREKNENPVDYLYKKYGTLATDGEQGIGQRMEKMFIAQNKQLKEKIERIDKKVADKEVYKIKVGSPGMGTFTMLDMPISYDFKGKSASIETISQEIKLGDNRLKLTRTELVKKDGSLYLFVPKSDVEIKDGKLSIQTTDIQVFDQPFEEKEGILELTQ